MITAKVIAYTLTNKKGMNYTSENLLECLNILRQANIGEISEKEKYSEEFLRVNAKGFEEESVS